MRTRGNKDNQLRRYPQLRTGYEVHLRRAGSRIRAKVKVSGRCISRASMELRGAFKSAVERPLSLTLRRGGAAERKSAANITLAVGAPGERDLSSSGRESAVPACPPAGRWGWCPGSTSATLIRQLKSQNMRLTSRPPRSSLDYPGGNIVPSNGRAHHLASIRNGYH